MTTKTKEQESEQKKAPNKDGLYKIRISYKTGNSFGSQDEVGEVEHTWNDPDALKESVRRIKEHYEWYQDEQRFAFNKKGLTKPAYVHPEYEWSLKLVADGGTEFDYGTFWIGYFESLDELEVVLNLPKETF